MNAISLTNPIADDRIKAFLAAARPSYAKWFGTAVGWVNWRRDSCQITMSYDDVCGFFLCVDIKAVPDSQVSIYQVRDAALKRLHAKYSKVQVCTLMNGEASYDFRMEGEFLGAQEVINAVLAVCPEGVEIRVFYVQDSSSCRPHFPLLARALVPGETGLVWKDGMLSGYANLSGANF